MCKLLVSVSLLVRASHILVQVRALLKRYFTNQTLVTACVTKEEETIQVLSILVVNHKTLLHSSRLRCSKSHFVQNNAFVKYYTYAISTGVGQNPLAFLLRIILKTSSFLIPRGRPPVRATRVFKSVRSLTNASASFGSTINRSRTV